MILGLLSDTHGQSERAANAIALLKEHGATAFVHCGDLCGEGVMESLAGERAWFVWGNCDLPDAGMRACAAGLGLPLPQGVPLRLEVDGRRLAVFHGHEREFGPVYRLLAGETATAPAGFEGVDYVLYGHTHVKNDLRLGSLRIINPGALHRAKPYTVATLDLQSDELQFHQVR